MRLTATLIFFLSFISSSYSQSESNLTPQGRKGDFYFYWGYNRGWFSNSDITLHGSNYDFELKNVVAKDRQSPLRADVYLNPVKFTIPQYNFRVGYFINNKYNISIGADHMKYVMVQNQTVNISGAIAQTETIYDKTYNDEEIVLAKDFLIFEHTDGLNYLNVELRRFDNLFDFKKVKINFTEGIGIGALYPRTNATLLNNERNDQFHVAGFGISAVAGINLELFDRYFIQSEYKGGFIDMPDIRTTMFKTDKAKQTFFFSQVNIVFGAFISVNKK